MASSKKSFTVGSTYLFTLSAVRKDGTIWDLGSATVNFYLRDPSGNIATKTATVSGDGSTGIATYSSATTDIDETNNGQVRWARRWKITDGAVVQWSHWIEMDVPD